MTRFLHFIGVSTGESSIMRLFPLWAEILEIDAVIRGRDLPLGAGREEYRAVVDEIRRHRDISGALVTTHKVDVFRHAGDLFDELDPYARICREISCISKRDGALIGYAKDPITAGLALEHMLGRGYWSKQDAHALCLGAGGAGTAITVRLLGEDDPPARIVVTDTDGSRIEILERIHREVAPRAEVAYRTVVSPADSDALLAALPARSLIINATGMGKDLPGSPLTDDAVFPREGVVWDLNYRGELDFLHQARAQEATSGLVVHDGWRYFLHGWTEVIVEVFRLKLTTALFAELACTAQPFRPPTSI